MKNLHQEKLYKEYVSRELLFTHASLEPEMDFYNAVASGNEALVRSYLKEDFLKKEGLGTLSNDLLMNARYHFAITAALVARSCIKQGLSMEESYSMSDFYIQQADIAGNTTAITHLHDEMALDYCRKMFSLKKDHIYSKPVIACINYIYSHLHTCITLTDLSALVKLSPSYLSRLFKKETGIGVARYIMEQKLETAKNMIEYSDYSLSEISSILAFPSQSHFTECFRKYTGTTPSKWNTTEHSV